MISYHGAVEGEDALAREVAAEVGAELCLPFDVRERASVRALMQAAADAHGQIDVLVNNAGINRVGDFDQITDEMWDDVLDTNLKGVFLCCQEALPHLPDGGRVNTGTQVTLESENEVRRPLMRELEYARVGEVDEKVRLDQLLVAGALRVLADGALQP